MDSKYDISTCSRNGGKCYYECKGRDILTNVTFGDVSSTQRNKEQNPMFCLWVISTSTNSSHNVVYDTSPLTNARGTVTFTFSELNVDCRYEHVEVYDGIPPFILDTPAVSSLPFYKLGSFCGKTLLGNKSVETHRGNLVIRYNGENGYFTGRFTVNRCPNFCTGNRHCSLGSQGKLECLCKEGWKGPTCDMLICPGNCSADLGQGHCNEVRDIVGYLNDQCNL